MENIDTKKYNIIPVYITREGKFISPHNAQSQSIYVDKISKFRKVEFVIGEPKIKIGNKLKKTINIDCVLNCMHGVNGEDGTISGLCQLCNMPITCPNALSSAICMDKIIMKDIFRANDLPCVDYIYFTRYDLHKNTKKVIEDAEKLGYPLIVKPANLGSSIGIAIAHDKAQLKSAIIVAEKYDSRIIVEKCIQNLREVNCSCLGDENECQTSLLEEPNGWEEFLDFNEKYIKSKKQEKDRFDVNLPPKTKQQIQDLAKKAFKVFCCSGVIRIDFMIDTDLDKVYINELNTIPGSLAFYLWKHKYSYSQLIDQLVEIAINKNNTLNMNNYSYKSDVLLINKRNNLNKYTK